MLFTLSYILQFFISPKESSHFTSSWQMLTPSRASRRSATQTSQKRQSWLQLGISFRHGNNEVVTASNPHQIILCQRFMGSPNLAISSVEHARFMEEDELDHRTRSYKTLNLHEQPLKALACRAPQESTVRDADKLQQHVRLEGHFRRDKFKLPNSGANLHIRSGEDET